jgi:transcriptional regulator GlxA family with amidase domain
MRAAPFRVLVAGLLCWVGAAAGAGAATAAGGAATAAGGAATAAAGATATATATPPAPKTVLIPLYDDVESQDFGVPFEVFNTASDVAGYKAFKVLLAAESPGLVASHSGMRVMPDCTFADCPQPDVLVVPGGPGIFKAMQRQAVVDFVRRAAARSEVVIGVCIGSMLMAKTGLLDGVTVTTHELGIDYLAQLAPRAKVVRGPRFVDSGKVVTSSGMVPSIEMSLHVVARLLGDAQARGTAAYLAFGPMASETK